MKAVNRLPPRELEKHYYEATEEGMTRLKQCIIERGGVVMPLGMNEATSWPVRTEEMMWAELGNGVGIWM